jgi:hypothetical protein
MDNATETLLIIVSVTLTVFLIVLIIALLFLIKLFGQLRGIARQAQHVADSVESAAGTFQKAAPGLAALSMIANIVDKAYKIRKKKG